MVHLKKISLPEVRKGIAIAYDGDQDLFDKYHVKQCDLFSAVMTTLEMIRETAAQRNLSYYKVVYKQIPIGYVVVFDDFLYSYGINKKFRKKEILIDWWDQVKKITGRKFFSMLYKNNKRAEQFLLKQGMKIHSEDEETITFYNEN
jgi:hypothetical protein